MSNRRRPPRSKRTAARFNGDMGLLQTALTLIKVGCVLMPDKQWSPAPLTQRPDALAYLQQEPDTTDLAVWLHPDLEPAARDRLATRVVLLAGRLRELGPEPDQWQRFTDGSGHALWITAAEVP